MDKKIGMEIIDIKKKLEKAGINTSNLLYCPAMPIVMGMERTFIVEEFMGIKIARLVSAGENN